MRRRVRVRVRVIVTMVDAKVGSKSVFQQGPASSSGLSQHRHDGGRSKHQPLPERAEGTRRSRGWAGQLAALQRCRRSIVGRPAVFQGCVGAVSSLQGAICARFQLPSRTSSADQKLDCTSSHRFCKKVAQGRIRQWGTVAEPTNSKPRRAQINVFAI